MIDTTRFSLDGIKPPNQRIKSGELGHSFVPPKDNEGNNWWVYYTNLEGPYETKIRMTYYPQDVYQNPHPLSLIECSLPKLVYGNNIEMLMKPEKALQVLQPIVSHFFKREIDLNKYEVDQIDLCYNHDVGSYVRQLIGQIFKLSYKRRTTKPYYPTNGVQFYSKAATLTFYDKEEESENGKAKGILRQEASYCTKRSVRSALGVKRPVFISNFTPDVVEIILRRELERIGFNETVIADPTMALKFLVSKHGSEQGMRLFGYMHALNIADTQDLMDIGIPPRTVYRSKKVIKESGLFSALDDQNLMLPSLTIDLKSAM